MALCSVSAVRTLREHYKDTPIFAKALDSLHAAELRTAGATDIITANTEVATEMGSQLLQYLGANANGVSVKVCRLASSGACSRLPHTVAGILGVACILQ